MLADHPAVDVLVNNAGRSIRRSVALSYDRFHDFERTIKLNYLGTIKLVMGVLPHMRDRHSGHVINVSSIGVQTNPPRFSAYVASKHAVVGITKSTAVMYASQNIRCNAVAPGAVITPIAKNITSSLGGRVLGPILAGTMPSLARAESVAATITFLLSDDSANTTGAIVTSDGGWSAL